MNLMISQPSDALKPLLLHHPSATHTPLSSFVKLTKRRRCFRTRTSSSSLELELPFLPFPKDQSLSKKKKLFVHFVLDPVAVNETFTDASFAARYGCLVTIEKVERLDVSALVFIRGIGRVKIARFAQEEPFLRGAVIPFKDHSVSSETELTAKVLELKEAVHSLNSLEIKLKAAPQEALLQTQTANCLQWAEKTPALDCEEAFVPSLTKRISFAALQPVSGSTQSELLKLQMEKLIAMEAKSTLERLDKSIGFVRNNISIVAAKLALQSIKVP